MDESLYAKYVKERLGDEIFENEKGFATYRYLNEGKTVYIVDLYMLPDCRREHEASRMANIICAIAKDRGATELIGTVNPHAKNATDSLRVLLGYGMALFSSTSEMIVFRKEL